MSLITNEDVFKFLEFYRNEELIWNPRHIYHKDKKKVNDAWARISNELEIPVTVLKKKKEALMATFRQHLKKKKASISSGCGEEDVYHPIWVFYDTMESFLADVYECSSKINTLTQKIADEFNSSNEQTEAGHGDEEENHRRSSSETTMQDRDHSPWKRTVLKRRSSNPPELQKASEQMEHALNTLNAVLMNKSNQREDICDQYGKLMASKLRKYFSDIEQQEVMFELDELVAKRIRNRLYQHRVTSSPSATSSGSLASTSTPEMHRPSSSQTFYVSSNSPIASQRPHSSHNYYSVPVLHIPEQENTVSQNIIMCSPQHQQLLQPTSEPRNQIQILSDEIIDSTRLNPILKNAFSKAMCDDDDST